jgi:peroxin-7
VAICAAANYGIIGNGRLLIQQEAATQLAVYTTNSALSDSAWSELIDSQCVAACADGSLKLYDLAAQTEGRPLMAFVEHRAEVTAVDWNLVKKDTFVSSSWDGTLKVWDPTRGAAIATFVGHAMESKIWEARCAPHHAGTVLSAAADGTVRLWDIGAGSHAALVVPCNGGEVLSVDWCKYDPNVFASACVDGVMRTHDIRQPRVPLANFVGHTLAVRRVRFSPHSPTLLLTASYDTSVCLFDTLAASAGAANALFRPATNVNTDAPASSPLRRFSHHREFVVGLEWSLFQEGIAFSCGWDAQMVAWQV